jgi:hypothetical protein
MKTASAFFIFIAGIASGVVIEFFLSSGEQGKVTLYIYRYNFPKRGQQRFAKKCRAGE